jgi:hypothetical protein
MVVPHYTYLVLKMPGPNGIITVKGSFELSDICDKEFHKMVQTFGIIAEHGQIKEKTGKETTSRQAEESKTNDVEPEAKKLWIQEEDPGITTTSEPMAPVT